MARRRPALVAAGAVYLALAVALFGHAWADPVHRWVGAPQDAPLFIWDMRWWPWAIGHGHNPLFSHFLNVPHGVNLTWVTSVPALSLAFAPFTLTAGPVFAYDAAATLALAGSAFAAFVVLRRVVVDARAAFAGGLLFGFSPFMIAQSLGHLMVTAAALLPVTAGVLAEALVLQRRPAWQSGLALGLLVALQYYAGEEMLAILIISAVVGVACLALVARAEVARRWRHGLRAVLIAAAFALAATGPALAFQLAGPGALHGPIQPPDRFVADATSFVVPTPVQSLRPFHALKVSSRYSAAGAEYDAYLGLPLLMFMAWAVAAERRRRWVAAAGLASVVIALLALGPHLHIDGRRTSLPLPWAVVGRTPLLDSLLPVRLMVAVDFLAGALLAVGLDRLLRLRRRGATMAASATAAAVALTLWPALPFASTDARVPAFFRTAAVQAIPAGTVALVAPYAEPATSQVLGWQAASGFRFAMLGGTFPVPDPRGRPEFVGDDNAAWRVIRLLEQGQQPNPADPDVPNLMKKIGIDSILVGPMVHEDRAVAYFTAMVGRPPTYQGGIYRWTGVLTDLARR